MSDESTRDDDDAAYQNEPLCVVGNNRDCSIHKYRSRVYLFITNKLKSAD